MKRICAFFLNLTLAVGASSSGEMTMPITPIKIILEDGIQAWQESLTPTQQASLKTWGRKLDSGTVLVIETPEGTVDHVAFRPTPDADFWQFAGLAKAVPAGGTYQFNMPFAKEDGGANLISFAWEMGKYEFNRYKKPSDPKPYPTLIMPEADDAWVKATVEATTLVRDLISTPANHMMPNDLAAVAQTLADKFGAQISVMRGEELKTNFPCVDLVGKSSDNKPCFIDINWQPTVAPVKTITLVGKGVCFDSGGLDIKPASGMLYMKKDMGGAAHVLGLAHMIMSMNLPVKLRVLVPAVENAINGSAMRPGDVIKSRKGTSIEIDNTDAEGRLILCDALTAAAEEKPDLIIDFATLTGAARTSVGTEIGALFSNKADIARKIQDMSELCEDLVWHQPLHKPYAQYIKGKVADITNCASYPYAGHITAALYLDHFVPKDIPWVHLDIMAYNSSSKPGRPEGGEAMGMRAMYEFIKNFIQ